MGRRIVLTFVYLLTIFVISGDRNLPVNYNVYVHEEDAKKDGEHYMRLGKFANMDVHSYHVDSFIVHDTPLNR